MTYSLPVFNRTCRIVTPASVLGPAEEIQGVPLQVKGIPRLYSSVEEYFGTPRSTVLLKMPPGTRVFGGVGTPVTSIVYVDYDGFETRYDAVDVWDVASGFPNEYRVVLGLRKSPLPVNQLGGA